MSRQLQVSVVDLMEHPVFVCRVEAVLHRYGGGPEQNMPCVENFLVVRRASSSTEHIFNLSTSVETAWMDSSCCESAMRDLVHLGVPFNFS
jgi:hypothetical protein